jgi:hypothetical protein
MIDCRGFSSHFKASFVDARVLLPLIFMPLFVSRPTIPITMFPLITGFSWAVLSSASPAAGRFESKKNNCKAIVLFCFL